MAVAAIGIGSNLGDRKANCLRALELLAARGVRITAVSSMLETEPWGRQDQPPFINMAALVETEEKSPARGLLENLLAVEKEMGRARGEKWGPRIIDLDLLLYGREVIEAPGIRVPHPFMEQRRFVLEPLAEIAPEMEHPVLKISVRGLLEKIR